MFKEEMTIKEFQELDKKEGIFAFLSQSGCSLCKIYEEQNKANPVTGLIKVSGSENELMAAGLLMTPMTIIYKEGKPVYRLPGVIFGKQKKTLESEYKKFFGGTDGN